MFINGLLAQFRKYADVLFMFCPMAFLMISCSPNTKNTMKKLEVTKINATTLQVDRLPDLLDQENISFQSIDCVNWSDYPYRPNVNFRIAYTDNAVLLNFKVKEKSVRARYREDNDSVWTDSCVEFFIIPANDGIYYNIECNCIGTLLIGAGTEKTKRERATQDVTSNVQRWSSLGNQPFEERAEETDWEMSLIIPYTAFFKHRISSLERKTVKANFYKCGDELQTPHFLSWNPIGTGMPNFHLPEFFGALVFN